MTILASWNAELLLVKLKAGTSFLKKDNFFFPLYPFLIASGCHCHKEAKAWVTGRKKNNFPTTAEHVLHRHHLRAWMKGTLYHSSWWLKTMIWLNLERLEDIFVRKTQRRRWRKDKARHTGHRRKQEAEGRWDQGSNAKIT